MERGFRALLLTSGKARARVLLIVVIQATGCCVTDLAQRIDLGLS